MLPTVLAAMIIPLVRPTWCNCGAATRIMNGGNVASAKHGSPKTAALPNTGSSFCHTSGMA